MTDIKWYYSFDSTTYEYIGMFTSYAGEQPVNTTEVPTGDLMDPIWNPATQMWTGKSFADELEKMRAAADKNPANAPIAELIANLAKYQETTNKSIATLISQVAGIQAQVTDIASKEETPNA